MFLRVIISLFFMPCFGQQPMVIDSLLFDLQLFTNILKEAHPFINSKTDQHFLASMHGEAIASLQNNPSYSHFGKQLYKIGQKIGDGHLSITIPNPAKNIHFQFPFEIKIIKDKAYITRSVVAIPSGSEIISLNKRPIVQILKEFKKYILIDGEAYAKVDNELSCRFNELYAQLFPLSKQLDITYKTPTDTTITKKISLTNFSEGIAKRQSEHYHFKFVEARKYGAIATYYSEAYSLLLIDFPTFQIPTHLFKTNIDAIFKYIEEKQLQKLIIDIRNNKGGNRTNTAYLFSYLTSKPYKQLYSTEVTNITIPYKPYVIAKKMDEGLTLDQKYREHITIDGWVRKFDDLEPIMIPFKNSFKGSIYFLINGGTLKEASSFAMLGKQNDNISLIGQPTGSAKNYHTGGYQITYQLPYSKIKVTLYLEKYNFFYKSAVEHKNTGVQPDYYVGNTPHSLITEKDAILNYAKKLVTN